MHFYWDTFYIYIYNNLTPNTTLSPDYMSGYLLFTSCIYLFDLHRVISSVVINKKELSTVRLVWSIICSKSKYLLFADLQACLRLFLLSVLIVLLCEDSDHTHVVFVYIIVGNWLIISRMCEQIKNIDRYYKALEYEINRQVSINNILRNWKI